MSRIRNISRISARAGLGAGAETGKGAGKEIRIRNRSWSRSESGIDIVSRGNCKRQNKDQE